MKGLIVSLLFVALFGIAFSVPIADGSSDDLVESKHSDVGEAIKEAGKTVGDLVSTAGKYALKVVLGNVATVIDKIYNPNPEEVPVAAGNDDAANEEDDNEETDDNELIDAKKESAADEQSAADEKSAADVQSDAAKQTDANKQTDATKQTSTTTEKTGASR